MVQFKTVFLRMILVIMILSLISGCGNQQNNMHQKDGQVENVLQEEMEAVGDSFTLKMDEETFCKEDACLLWLSDSVAGCFKGMRAPVLNSIATMSSVPDPGSQHSSSHPTSSGVR